MTKLVNMSLVLAYPRQTMSCLQRGVFEHVLHTRMYTHICTHMCTHIRTPHREACKRQLGMVTYKVVPFSPIAGLIEWVQVQKPFVVLA
jgi:hypothetical protein